MMDPDFAGLASLIDKFAEEKEAFEAEHALDYNSQACWDAYDRKDEALEELQDALRELLNQNPRALSAVLRQPVS